MPEEEMELASKVSGIMSHFPEVWQEYQDWLRDIVSSRTDLLSRYPAWQVSVIFRWRLLYFAVYVAGVVLCDQFLKRLRAFFVGGNVVKARLLSAKAAIAQALAGQLTSRFPSSQRYRYILQRTATLLAVAELTLCGVAALTGVLLAFYYQPAAMGAHESLTRIMHTITNGTLILSLHQVAGHGLIILALVQIVVMFLGREFLLSWLTGWISGILLTLTAIGLSWTAIVLSWEQTSFWRFKVELSIVGSIPLVGATLKEILSGGSGISSITLQHMYAFHSYVLAIAAILLSVIHLTALLFQEQTWKPTEKRFSFAKGCQRAAPNRNAPSA
ncbi:MAG: cytochrome bc complex cytochrome b subunit [Leptolyngbya sp. SIO1E4]|nr:cytochrome bc complex cytochrome b subunit [Leptolyngbya sp. SIO1E4]